MSKKQRTRSEIEAEMADCKERLEAANKRLDSPSINVRDLIFRNYYERIIRELEKELDMAKHQKTCECSICKAMVGGKSREEAFREMEKKQDEWMKKEGWYAHYVGIHDTINDLCNYHTHGISVTFPGQMDFQIVVPLSIELSHTLFATFVDRLREGERFHEGQKVSEIIKKYDILLVKAKECERDVLCIILPDKLGQLEKSKMSGIWKKQYLATS